MARVWQATAIRRCECGRWSTPSRIIVYAVPEKALQDVKLAVQVKCPECGEHYMMPFQEHAWSEHDLADFAATGDPKPEDE